MAGRYEEAFEIATELGDRRLLSRSLFDLSFTWFVSGDINDAIRRLEEVLTVAEDDDVALQAKAHLGIGYTLVFRGDIDGAGEPFERAIALLRTSEERFALYEALSSFATLHWLTGSIDRARIETAEATDLVLASPTPLAFSQIVALHEIAAVHEGRFRDAAILHGMWERIEDEYEVNFPEVGRAFLGDPAEQIRGVLGADGFAEARAVGHAMTMAEMIERIREPKRV
jgi:tetratricopeptide (TPR) repeat protein